MKNKNDIKETLSHLDIFKNCDKQTYNTVTAGAVTQIFEKGKILFVQEEQAERYYMMISGWVKLFRETLDGAQAVIDILPKSSIFGEMSIFNDDLYPYSAEIVDNAHVISLPLATLKSEINKNGTLTMNMLRHVARHNNKQGKEIEHLALQSAPQRIGCFLLRLIDQEKSGAATLHLPYDKTLIAARLGMQPETFSRALRKLRDATDIDISGATITIENVKNLENYACMNCSSGFPCKDLKKIA